MEASLSCKEHTDTSTAFIKLIKTRITDTDNQEKAASKFPTPTPTQTKQLEPTQIWPSLGFGKEILSKLHLRLKS